MSKNKIIFYAALIPLIYLVIGSLLIILLQLTGIRSIEFFKYTSQFSFLVITLFFSLIALGLPLTISLLIGVKILEGDKPKSIFLFAPLSVGVLSIILVNLFFFILKKLWYVETCCYHCDFAGLEIVFYFSLAIVIAIVNIIVSLAAAYILYKTKQN